jgi:ketosteroid isomerase-like protein
LSHENIELCRRAVEAQNRRDAAAILDALHPDVEWYPGLSAKLAGEATVNRGHAAVREWLEELWETFPKTYLDFPDLRDLGQRVIGIGRMRSRGQASGIEWETPVAYLVDIDAGKMTRVRTYLDGHEALEAAGLRE